MGRLNIFPSRATPARKRGSAAPASADTVMVEAQADILRADAEVARIIQTRTAEIDLAEREALSIESAARRAESRKRREARLKRATRVRTRRARQRARRSWWMARKAHFRDALAGRLVLVLVTMAAATAWYGQFKHLGGPVSPPVDSHGHPMSAPGMGLPLPFAVAGATALEVLGLAMFAIARKAGDFRERALRARLLGWAVIAFSAWSNDTHNGIVLAAMSVAGPLAWEIHEWWQRREVLHAQGKLVTRPVRPRFPLDQVLLFPWWTLCAYRVAVRDRIESAERALELAKIERRDRSIFGWRNRRRFRTAIRTAIESSNRALIERARGEMEVALKIRSEAEGILAVGAMLLGAEHTRQVAHRVDLVDRARSSSIQQASTIGTTSAASTAVGTDVLGDSAVDPVGSTALTRSSRSKDRSAHRPRWSLRRRSTDRHDRIEAGSTPPPEPTIGRGPIEVPGAAPIDQQSAESNAESAGAPEPEERPTAPGSIASSSITGRNPNSLDTTRSKTGLSTTRSGRSRRRSIDELRAEAADLIQTEGWSGDVITAEALRLALHCSPKRARQLREEFRSTAKTTTTQAGPSVA